MCPSPARTGLSAPTVPHALRSPVSDALGTLSVARAARGLLLLLLLLRLGSYLGRPTTELLPLQIATLKVGGPGCSVRRRHLLRVGRATWAHSTCRAQIPLGIAQPLVRLHPPLAGRRVIPGARNGGPMT